MAEKTKAELKEILKEKEQEILELKRVVEDLQGSHSKTFGYLEKIENIFNLPNFRGLPETRNILQKIKEID